MCAGSARAAPASRHTTTLAAASADGGLAGLTFTHGPWFGSGLVAPGTGVVLNGGANLFAATPNGGRAGTNMAPLVVDLHMVDFMDSSGLAALLELRSRARQVGWSVSVRGASGRVRELLARTGTLTLVEVEPDDLPAAPA